MLQGKAAALGWGSPESLCRWAAPVPPETPLLALTLVFSCLSSYLGAGPCLALLWDQCWAQNKSWLHGGRVAMSQSWEEHTGQPYLGREILSIPLCSL